MKILKRNQLIILVIGLMLVTAGYLNYTTDPNKTTYTTSGETLENTYAGIGDATLVNGGALVENEEIEESDIQNSSSVTSIEGENIEEEKNTSVETANQTNEDYYTESKLERDNMYSQMLESYQKMLDSTSVSEEQKAIAQTEIKRINDNKNAIMIAENLIKTKGIEDLVIFINGESINVIVKGDDLEKEEIAQIQNIITRELEADIANIHIMNK